MSNETDLEWLARNVHEWPKNRDDMIGGFIPGSQYYGPSCAEIVWCKGGITKRQWLARRAELQNKPSWADAPEWATLLAQDSAAEDGLGAWWWYEAAPTECERTWIHQGRAYPAQFKGEVLGDWRDTLEKRPEQKAFEPFASIEDNQEQDMTKQQEMKQDSGWFERGELPPVGVVCEAYIDYPPRWVEAEIVAHKDGFAIGWCKSVMKGCHGDKASEFRPIRTERDVLLSVIVEEMNHYDTDGKLADAILAAGFSLGAK